MDYNFNWDNKKAKSNLAKHKTSFEMATNVFKDENAISIYDEEHSEHEDRWITIGMDLKIKVIVVVHTYIKMDENLCTIRIISARKATKNERLAYMGDKK